MRKLVCSLTLVLGLGGAMQPVAAVAGEPQYNMALPEGVTLVELFRYYNAGKQDRYTGREMPENWERIGWRLEGTLGFISYTPFAGSTPLYSCLTNEKVPDAFSSPYPDCEGQGQAYWAPIIGYVATTQIPGTVPLYRCDTPRYAEDHFDSLSSTCEGNKPGAVNEGILGYVFW